VGDLGWLFQKYVVYTKYKNVLGVARAGGAASLGVAVFEEATQSRNVRDFEIGSRRKMLRK